MAAQVEAVKWVPGTKFIVDGFRFQSPACAAYFLTHAHSDHTTGLTSSFAGGPIFCSPTTARILRHDFPSLRPSCLRILELDVPATICGVEVTALDANHCPGAVMLLFRVPAAAPGGKTQTILHTGDMRWHAGMAQHPALRGQQVDVLMLDTTYCAPRWAFPPQQEAVAALAQLMAAEAAAATAEGGRLLCVVGSYHIGKERAYLGAAHQLGWRVHCAPAKRRLLRLLGLPPEWLALLTDAPEEAQVHVLGMGEQLHEQVLADRIAGTRWTRVLAVKPTGWSFRPKAGLERRAAGCVTLVGVPYSEHSSFPELRDCVRALRPRRLVPTVGAVGEPAKARAIIDRFADLMDLSRDRSRLDCYLARPPKTASERQGGASPPGSQGGAAAAAAGGSQEGDPPEAQRQGGVPPADSSGAGGEAWSPADAAGASGSCEVGGPQHSAAAAAGPAGPAPLPAQQEQQQQQQASEADVDLAAIDVREQQRILSHIQWEQRRAASSSAASQGSPKSGGGSSSSRRSGACSGGKKRGPAAGGGDSRTAGLQQPSVKRFFQPTQGSPT